MGTPTVKPLPRDYTPQEIRDRFNWTRQMLYQKARLEQWHILPQKNGNLFLVADVNDYSRSRLRTKLLRQLGFVYKGLIRQEDFDTTCPQCGASAVWKPTGLFQEEIDPAQADAQPWIC